MKFVKIVSLVLVSTTSVLASDFSPKDMPATIKCSAKIRGNASPSFKIEKFDTTSPDATIADASLMDYTVGNNIVDVGFSNECDNSYSFVFFTLDLIKLKKKEMKKIIGMVNYFNADMNYPAEEGPSDYTTIVTCTL